MKGKVNTASDLDELNHLREENMRLTFELLRLQKKQKELDDEHAEMLKKVAQILIECATCLDIHSLATVALKDFKKDKMPNFDKILEMLHELDDEQIAGLFENCMLTMMRDATFI